MALFAPLGKISTNGRWKSDAQDIITACCERAWLKIQYYRDA